MAVLMLVKAMNAASRGEVERLSRMQLPKPISTFTGSTVVPGRGRSNFGLGFELLVAVELKLPFLIVFG